MGAMQYTEVGAHKGQVLHTCICKNLLREVVDELAVDKAADAVINDLFALLTHLVLLSHFDICHLQ
jgi:hypothetical protein